MHILVKPNGIYVCKIKDYSGIAGGLLVTQEDGEAVIIPDIENCSVLANVEVPDDVTPGKYKYVDGEFIINEDYVDPNKPPDKDPVVEQLEAERAKNQELEALLFDATTLLQEAGVI